MRLKNNDVVLGPLTRLVYEKEVSNQIIPALLIIIPLGGTQP